MPKIDYYWLVRHGACGEALKAFKNKFENRNVELIELIELMKRERNQTYLEWALWLLPPVMTKIQLNQYALDILKRILPKAKQLFKTKEDRTLLKWGLEIMEHLKSKTNPLSINNSKILSELKETAVNNQNTDYKMRINESGEVLYLLVKTFLEDLIGRKKCQIQDALEMVVLPLSYNERGRITNKKERSVSLQLINMGMKILAL